MRNIQLRDLKLVSAGLVITLLLISLSPASASSANISHSYYSENNIQNGSLVSLNSLHSNYVEPANSGNGQQLLGVAVASNDSLLAVDPTQGEIQVATSGTANTLVSSINGSITVGEQVSVSPLDGLGMKASPGEYVIGLAQTQFNGSTLGVITEKIQDKSGKSTQIQVGYVRLGIAIGAGATSGTENKLSGLQTITENLTGHVVSTARIVVSLIIAVVTFVALVTLIYASIYSGILSIGRNPLAKSAVFRSMGSVFGMVVLIAAVASVTIIFLLK